MVYLISVRNKRILQQKLVGKHKRFVCYKRGKFKGTGEAGTRQICIAFQCVTKEEFNGGGGGMDLNDLLTSNEALFSVLVHNTNAVSGPVIESGLIKKRRKKKSDW